jgi:seryl-tRNA synthetase
MNTQDKTNPVMIVELVDSVVKPLLVVSDELNEVKKELSKTQKAFEGLAYQSATVREQLEFENKTLTKEREALELLVKKFNANLADLENLSETLSQEVRSGIKSASKALSDAIKDEVEASVRQTVDASAAELSFACQKNIKVMNDYEALAFTMNIRWMLCSLLAAFLIALTVFYFFKHHMRYIPCISQCTCKMEKPQKVEEKKDVPVKK